MAEKTGIKETTEFAQFVNAVVAAVRDFKKRGIKPSVTNILRSIGDFLPAILAAEDAFTGVDLIPGEWKDLSKEEAAKIMALFNDGVDLKDKLTEAEVEELFGASVLWFIAVRNLIQKNAA
jgi:hypothetical protein